MFPHPETGNTRASHTQCGCCGNPGLVSVFCGFYYPSYLSLLCLVNAAVVQPIGQRNP